MVDGAQDDVAGSRERSGESRRSHFQLFQDPALR